MDTITNKEKIYYILGCIEAKAFELAQTIDTPVEQCRGLLLNQIIKYFKNGTRNISDEDAIKYGIIKHY